MSNASFTVAEPGRGRGMPSSHHNSRSCLGRAALLASARYHHLIQILQRCAASGLNLATHSPPCELMTSPNFAALLTRGESCGMFYAHGVADAELRWIHPRGIPRPEQRAQTPPASWSRYLRSAAGGGGQGGAERGDAMTTHRDLKRIIRERQRKTGESYTGARLHGRRERAALL